MRSSTSVGAVGDESGLLDELKRIRHSVAHILAQAVVERFSPDGDVHLAIGPPTDDGFYYDFELPRPVTENDLEALEARMKEVIKSHVDFAQRPVAASEARELFRDQPFKLELIESILKGSEGASGPAELSPVASDDEQDGELGTCTHGDFLDLCRGHHVHNSRDIDPDAIKLLSAAGAYWRGDENRPMLQRIYGTAWRVEADLKDFLWRREQAELRDHRRIGKELELFHFDPTSPGMPYWLPKGLRVMNTLLAFWRDEHERRGYDEIATPLVNNKKLWETSGHWAHYRDDMFIIPDGEQNTWALKPMNCPNAMVVFNLKTRSYRDLPLRLSDCDPLHRNERSGTLHGLLRVQKFQQDDAHIFVTPDQIKDECEQIFDICDRFYGIFGLEYRFRLGTQPKSFLGDQEAWDEAVSTLTRILQERTGGNFEIEDGGGAFYGPKIDILMSDALGRSWQMGTIQLDFQLPRRFNCQYTDQQGQRKTPVVIHRVIYGSLERFLGIYIEHTAGAFPLWLAPVHAVVIPVGNDFTGYAHQVTDALRSSGVRAEMDARSETLGNRVRVARQQKIPVIVVVGGREAEQRTVSLRLRGQKRTTSMALDDFAAELVQSIRDRKDSFAVEAVEPAEG
jgi:threonyl-tRNA synthetase